VDNQISFEQLRMCIVNLLDPRAPDYFVALSWRIRGPLDIAALQRAMNVILERNVTLRTRYAITRGEPAAIIDDETTVDLIIRDASAVASDEELQETVSSLAHRPYQLFSDPVVRVYLVRAPGGEAVLLITVHHIAIDGPSADFLVGELSELFSAFAWGRWPVLDG
jgi:NRPS condensation-like uncharacterized protein